MKKIITILAITAMLLSCGKAQKNIGADDYYFEQETFTRLENHVTVVLVKDQAEMAKLLAEQGRSVVSGREVAAFSVLSMMDSSCTIYMIDPKISYQPEFIGHEFVHCLYGEWHKIQP